MSNGVRTLAQVPTDIHNNPTGKSGTESETKTTVSGYINNVNSVENTAVLGQDGNNNDIVTSIGPKKTITLGGLEKSNVERGAGIRYGNVSEVRLEIRYGTDKSVFELTDVYVDYIKAP